MTTHLKRSLSMLPSNPTPLPQYVLSPFSNYFTHSLLSSNLPHPPPLPQPCPPLPLPRSLSTSLHCRSSLYSRDIPISFLGLRAFEIPLPSNGNSPQPDLHRANSFSSFLSSVSAQMLNFQRSFRVI